MFDTIKIWLYKTLKKDFIDNLEYFGNSDEEVLSIWVFPTLVKSKRKI